MQRLDDEAWEARAAGAGPAARVQHLTPSTYLQQQHSKSVMAASLNRALELYTLLSKLLATSLFWRRLTPVINTLYEHVRMPRESKRC